MWKKWAKKIKLSENYTSMILGFIVVVILGVFVFNVFKRGNTGTINKGEVSIPGSSTEKKSEESPATGAKEHTVVKGESLWKIAEQYYKSGYNWVDIAKANKLTNPNIIEEGQKLTIPEAKAILPETGVTSQQPKQETYAVVKGDTLWSVAVNMYSDGYRWVDIAKANKLEDPNIIHAGNVLTLPK